VQAAVHRDDLAGRLAQSFARKDKKCFSLVCWSDRRFGQGAVRVKLSELLVSDSLDSSSENGML